MSDPNLTENLLEPEAAKLEDPQVLALKKDESNQESGENELLGVEITDKQLDPEEHKNTQLDLQPTTSPKAKTIKNTKLKIKKHIIDDLDFALTKYSSLPILTCKTPPSKFSSNQSKDFIKKNIERNSAYINNIKNSPKQADIKFSDFIEESFKKNSKKLDVNERFYKKAEDYKKKKEDLKEKIIKEELNACTFQPKTNVKDKIKHSPKDFNKKLDEYIEKKKKKQEEDVKSKELQEKHNSDEELTHQPKINAKSKEMISKKQTEGTIHERLYNQYKSQASKQIEELNKNKEISDPKKITEEPEIFFQPTINKKSQNLNRTDKIGQILYNDAIRRKNKPLQAPSSPIQKFMNSNSEKVLIEKFKRDFNEAVSELGPIESLKINYNQLLQVLKILYFIREDKEEEDRLTALGVWKIFGESEETSIPKDSVLSVLLGIMGLYEDWMSTETQIHNISREEALKLHKKYEKFYKNRNSTMNKSNMNQSFKNTIDYSFQPEKIANSDELAEKWRNSHREPGKIEDSLIAEQAKKEKKIKQLKQKIDAEALKECSFKPKTEELPSIYIKSTKDYSDIVPQDLKSTHKGVILYKLAEKNKNKKNENILSARELQEQKELEECTFSPNVLDKKHGNISNFFQRLQAREEFKEAKSLSPSLDTNKHKKVFKDKALKKKQDKIITQSFMAGLENEGLLEIKEIGEDHEVQLDSNLVSPQNVYNEVLNQDIFVSEDLSVIETSKNIENKEDYSKIEENKEIIKNNPIKTDSETELIPKSPETPSKNQELLPSSITRPE
jgi:hypothetical protein